MEIEVVANFTNLRFWIFFSISALFIFMLQHVVQTFAKKNLTIVLTDVYKASNGSTVFTDFTTA